MIGILTALFFLMFPCARICIFLFASACFLLTCDNGLVPSDTISQAGPDVYYLSAKVIIPYSPDASFTELYPESVCIIYLEQNPEKHTLCVEKHTHSCVWRVPCTVMKHITYLS